MINTNLVKEWLSKIESPQPTEAKLDLLLDLLLEELTEAVQAGTAKNQRNFIQLLEKAQRKLAFDLKSEDEKIDLIELRDAVADMFVVNANIVYHFGINDQKDFEDVMKSNNSKYCTTEEEAEATVQAYQSGTHWDKPNQVLNAFSEKVDNIYVIRNKDNGKILKSINYKPVELK